MPRLKDVCRYVRSKNAGPFWVTVDLFFDSPDSYGWYHADPAISAESIAAIYGVDAAHVKRFEVKSLNMVKISYPRTTPQGGVVVPESSVPQPALPGARSWMPGVLSVSEYTQRSP